MAFVTLSDRDGLPIAVDPSTIRTIKPGQYIDDEVAKANPGSPESFPWGTFLTPKRQTDDIIVVRETFEVVMAKIAKETTK